MSTNDAALIERVTVRGSEEFNLRADAGSGALTVNHVRTVGGAGSSLYGDVIAASGLTAVDPSELGFELRSEGVVTARDVRILGAARIGLSVDAGQGATLIEGAIVSGAAQSERGLESRTDGSQTIRQACVSGFDEAAIDVGNTTSVLIEEVDVASNAVGVVLGIHSTPDSARIVNSNIAGNSTGLRLDTTNSLDASSNWWGSSTGPQHPSNLGGLGDSVEDGANGAQGSATLTPFLTMPLDNTTITCRGLIFEDGFEAW